MTPLPATPLLQKAGSRWTAHPPEALARVHPFAMAAHTPLKMSIDEAHKEVRIGWAKIL